jgi:hypothetical protein
MSGTRSIPGESAHHAFISGPRRNASPVSSGRHTRIGMRSDLLILALDGNVALDLKAGLQIGSKGHTAAKFGTTGCARAFRRAFDWHQRCRLR